jgi:hypothetical protein
MHVHKNADEARETERIYFIQWSFLWSTLHGVYIMRFTEWAKFYNDFEYSEHIKEV